MPPTTHAPISAKLVADLFPPTTCASSTKGWTGHTLGAAGIVESLVALQPGQVNPGGAQSYAGPIVATVRPGGTLPPIELNFASSSMFEVSARSCC